MLEWHWNKYVFFLQINVPGRCVELYVVRICSSLYIMDDRVEVDRNSSGRWLIRPWITVKSCLTWISCQQGIIVAKGE